MKHSFAVVGIGHLGTALILGLLRAGFASENLTLVTRPERTDEFHSKFGLVTVGSVTESLERADYIFFATKRSVFYDIAEKIPEAAWSGKTIISLMAGVGIEELRRALGNSTEIVRAMPSLAIESLGGIIGYTQCASELAEVFESLGYAFEVPHDDIEKVTAFSGCGPGFAALILDAYVKAGISLGFSEKQACIIASRTFQATAERGGDYRSFADAVATPGGATESGIAILEGRDIYGILESTVKASLSKVTAPKI